MGRGNLAGIGQQHPGKSLLKHSEKVGVDQFVFKPKVMWNKMRESSSSKLEFLLFYMPCPGCPVQISERMYQTFEETLKKNI